jgi:hypothetical protein
MPYLGNPAVDRFTATKAASVYSGNGSTTAFTLEHSVGADEDILVSVDGVIQEPSVAYAVSSGTTLTFTAAPSSNSGNNIFVYYLFRTIGTVTHPSTSALSATNGTFSGNTTVAGTSTFTGNATFSADVTVLGDDLTIGDNTGDSELHLISATDNSGRINFGDSGDADIGVIQYEHDANEMVFKTNASEAFRVKSYGSVLFGTTNASPAEGTTAGTRIGGTGATQISVDGQTSMLVNRVQDGAVVKFMSAGSEEGSISISGSTTSYNGGHISRYSRLLDNSKNTSIVKGTVMTNLNEMVEWSHEEVLWTDEDELPDGVSVGDVKKSAYIEDNEQLNKMAVSSVEGDANVAGVFVNWDNDDDFNDMNIAMTGDMVIRIAKGTTVARGDLLMSAGDGTAKTQSDDIVRSKTIAKVTSTNVSHTYDDGTYLVPCVLMAC